MDDLARQLAARDHFRQKLAALMTPEDRMRAMARLQEAMWDTFRRSPDGYAHFLRRNFKARAIAVQASHDA